MNKHLTESERGDFENLFTIMTLFKYKVIDDLELFRLELKEVFTRSRDAKSIDD